MNTFEVDVEGRTYEVDAPDPNTAWKWANQFHAEAKGKREQAIKADQEATREAFKRDEAARPFHERALINIGAGMDTAWQGAKQLGAKVGLGSGVSDEELTEQRRVKGELAEGTTGGSLLQIAGEIAPTLALPVGAAGSLGRAAVMGAAGGAAAGALQPVLTSESRIGNMAMGATGGAVAPVAVRAVQKALPRALGGAGELSTQTRAGKRLVRALGGSDEAKDVARRVSAPRTSEITKDIPLSATEAAAQTGYANPALARIEKVARRDEPEAFNELTRRQNEAIHEAAVNRAGVEGNQSFVDIAKNARDIVTSPMRERALESAGRWSHVSEPLQAETQAILQRTAAGSPANRVAQHVQGVLDTNPNPQQLYDLRKDLVRRLSRPSGLDELSAAVKGADRETMDLVKAIDRRLNDAASSKQLGNTPWTNYLEEYSKQSPKVTSSRAQQQINERLTEEGQKTIGNAPALTRAGLKRAVDMFGENRYGSRLDPSARSRYNELMNFMAAKEEPLQTLTAAGSGPGSQTAMLQNMSVLTGHALSPKLRMLHMITDTLDAPVKAEVAQMMLDPARTAANIRAALQAGQPLSQGQQAFLAIARAGGAGAPAALTAQAGTE
jgi:hypothetical protein